MRCGGCGYSLDGLSLRSRCPECSSFERDSADAAEIQRLLGSKLRQSIWVPAALALFTALLGMMHPLLAPLVGLFMIMFVGVLAEDVTRLQGFLHPEWSPARWLASLVIHLAFYGAYFIVACIACWRLINSQMVRSFF
ncbi:MAG: hypothetical protein J0L78_03120 [Planctomycetes bacterium]|nr:hypothetical protein [Planctomycetota bacterium]